MKVTVIIPYKEDRGWLQQAIDSVPKKAQLILSKGDGNWPQNFNKALPQVKGDLVKFLHEDDMLADGAIEKYIEAFTDLPQIDFAHGNAREIFMNAGRATALYIPKVKVPTLQDLLNQNTIHSTSLIYRKNIFEKIGGFNESPTVYSFEEYEFNLRCLKAGLNLAYIDYIFGWYRRHPKQTIRTCNIAERRKNREALLNSYL
jgi:hypothetical protein